ncbi:DEAD/DEAH box helicase [Candidatus Riflebacteria bacterium]
MYPSILSHQIKKGVKDFLKTTFPISTPFFHGLLDRLLEKEETIFKGPYLSLQLPFKEGESGKDFFPELSFNFKSYFHQEQAFERLTGTTPKSTIIATGTGSGKTECFLYPILDYCYRNRGEHGIKAILIYPMNALAGDQASRLAALINNNPKLKGNIRAGLFIGQKEAKPKTTMGADHLITDKENMRLRPPDILLTNYRMLDFLLIRARDFKIWSQNKPESFKFLVVDELHTFDGPQGTDLACLLRRLKARLQTPRKYLCCVGTSATLGSSEEKNDLIDYAKTVFGEEFDSGSIVTESRKSAGDFLKESQVSFRTIPEIDELKFLNPENFSSYREFLNKQYELWFGESVEGRKSKVESQGEDDLRPVTFDPGLSDNNEFCLQLGSDLKGHIFFQNLLRILDGKIKGFEELIQNLEKLSPVIKGSNNSFKILLLNSLLSLVSLARDRTESDALKPLVNVRVQIWLRELRRMVAEVINKPSLAFADDLTKIQADKHLPIVHCRDCYSTGWAALKRENDQQIITDLQQFYNSFFNESPKVIFLFPEKDELLDKNSNSYKFFICTDCLRLNTDSKESCSGCGEREFIEVFIPDSIYKSGDRRKSHHDCPFCGSHDGLTILGSRAASLTSVMISQLFASEYNDDKKLITFSDSVQDAAHRAGFFSARTYQFNFRTALQQFIQNQEKPFRLSELAPAFHGYYLSRWGINRYIATFIGPDMEWLSEYDELKKDSKLTADRLLDKVNRRVEWGIYSEYCFRARVGRTLEKGGGSMAATQPGLLDKISNHLLETFQNEFGGLRNLDKKTFQQFVLGFFIHLKNQGAVFFPFLEDYLKAWGHYYQLTRKDFLPNFGRQSRTPVFLTSRSQTRFDSLSSKSSTKSNWYQAWATRCFAKLDTLLVTHNIFNLLIKTLLTQGIFKEWEVGNDKIWGILPENLHICYPVYQFRCKRCGHFSSVSKWEKDTWEEAPCLRFHCHGHYTFSSVASDYYGKLYSSGDIKRIYGAEHTGLLNRDDREELEKKFKQPEEKQEPWDPNLLSCTPTLEMGIDIGDLSSLVLCSVPPAQSNYVQRIGRAGRRDGNSLILTVGNARPHDLYFFASPDEMIQGKVETPGVFLEASRVLERQLMAFCFDTWIKEEVEKATLPKLGKVINNLGKSGKNLFPKNFLNHIEMQMSDILDNFQKLFSKPDLKKEIIEYLHKYLEGDDKAQSGLRWRILHGFYEQKKILESLKARGKTLTSKIKTKKEQKAKDQNYERDLGDLISERSAVMALIKDLRNKDTLNFFTDEGLLPNYSFPESGVLLKSVITRKKMKPQGSEKPYEIFTFEFERPAVNAISELAPQNLFYAGGRKVEVDQVDMGASEIEIWRFCDNCNYLERADIDENPSSCPRCESTQWGDMGQKKKMLRLRQVFATTSDKKSRIGDDSEDRQPVFYNKQVLVNFERSYIKQAYKVDEKLLPFGFEFISRVDLQEINFGEKGLEGEKLTIGGVELPRKGFTICKKCGKVQKGISDKPEHSFSCTIRKKDSKENLIECVYLYREFSSEAIRMLLPVLAVQGDENKLNSFVAALHLGLKLKFSGKIEHLQTTLYEEPIKDAHYRKKYLLLYDKVPGGTGYLKELMHSKDILFEVLSAALEKLKACHCGKDPKKDGCYQCLFAYKNSYDMEDTSRKEAITLLSEIIMHQKDTEKTDSLEKISLNSLFDSELEKRFIEALRRLKKTNPSVKLKNYIVNGRPGYYLQIEKQGYHIEPQVTLGIKDGVMIPCKPDFIFHPARAGSRKPIAVFTDGFTYHRDRIDDDLEKRTAIIKSGRYHVWSLSWNDVDTRFSDISRHFINYTHKSLFPGGNKINGVLKGYDLGEFLPYLEKDNLVLFEYFLAHPEETNWQKFAMALGLISLNLKNPNSDEMNKQWKEKIQKLVPENLWELFNDIPDNFLFGHLPLEIQNDESIVQYFISADPDAIRNEDPRGLNFIAYLNDSERFLTDSDFSQIWNGFFRVFNIFQFLPSSFFLSHSSKESRDYYWVDSLEGISDIVPESTEYAKEWLELRELTDSDYYPLLEHWEKSDCQVPQVGLDMALSEMDVTTTAEFAWEGSHLAFFLEEDLESKDAFEKEGWKIFGLNEVLKDREKYLAMIPEK